MINNQNTNQTTRNIDIIRRNGNGAYLQTCQYTGHPFSLIKYTTLNEKLGINADQKPIVGQYPSVKYFCIGNAGHDTVTGADDITLISPVEHSAEDFSLFNLVPFILRETNNDISMEERAKYGLRAIVDIRGTRYIAYYLKRFEKNTTVPAMYMNTVQNGVTTTEPYVPSDKNLNPKKDHLKAQSVNVATGSYLSVKSTLDILMDEDDLDEFMNACNIIYGNPLYSIISEIGLVSGYDKVMQVSTPGQQLFNMNEVVCAQVVTIVSTLMAASYRGSNLKMTIDIGATEPLFKLTSVRSG